jgi:hypothetical protein
MKLSIFLRHRRNMLLALPGGDQAPANRFAGKCSLVPMRRKGRSSEKPDRVVDDGAYAYLTKPLDLSEFFQVVGEATSILPADRNKTSNQGRGPAAHQLASSRNMSHYFREQTRNQNQQRDDNNSKRSPKNVASGAAQCFRYPFRFESFLRAKRNRHSFGT